MASRSVPQRPAGHHAFELRLAEACERIDAQYTAGLLGDLERNEPGRHGRLTDTQARMDAAAAAGRWGEALSLLRRWESDWLESARAYRQRPMALGDRRPHGGQP